MKTKNLKYNITISTAPTMPKLGKGTECVQLLLSQVSKDMHEPLVPMLFPILGAQVSEAKFQYPDLSWKELCGMMANLVADSGCNKGQLSNIVEAICHNFREHDEKELDKLVEWQRQMKTKSANKEKPARPDVSFWFPPSDVTNAAFIQDPRNPHYPDLIYRTGDVAVMTRTGFSPSSPGGTARLSTWATALNWEKLKPVSTASPPSGR